MTDQLVRTRQISFVLDRDDVSNVIPISFPRATHADLGLGAQSLIFSNRFIKGLRCRSRISSLGAPVFPDLANVISDDDRIRALIEAEKQSPHKTLQLLLSTGSSDLTWGELGTINFTNQGSSVNNKLSLFFTDSDTLEIDQDAIFACRIANDGHGLLSGDDWVHIYGLYKEQIFIQPLFTRSLTYLTPPAFNVAPGGATQVVGENLNRQYLVVSNSSDPALGGRIWLSFGTNPPQQMGGIPLWPGGSFKWSWSLLEKPITAPCWAWAEGATQQVGLIEGS